MINTSGEDSAHYGQGSEEPVSERVVAIEHERIDRKRVIFSNGRRRQQSRTLDTKIKNPTSIELAKIEGISYRWYAGDPYKVHAYLNGEHTSFGMSRRRDTLILANRMRGLAQIVPKGKYSKPRRRGFQLEVEKAFKAQKEREEGFAVSRSGTSIHSISSTGPDTPELKGLDKIRPETLEKLEAGAKRMLKMYGGKNE
jgi:hypothetical protein